MRRAKYETRARQLSDELRELERRHADAHDAATGCGPAATGRSMKGFARCRAVLAELDKATLGVCACSDTLFAIADTHRLIATGSSAGSVDSRNEAARLAVDQNAYDIWNCVQKVHALVDDVNKKAAKLYGSVSKKAVRGLDLSFSGNQADRRQRIRELNVAAKAIDDVAVEVNLIRMAFEERVKVLEEDVVRMLADERERLRKPLS